MKLQLFIQLIMIPVIASLEIMDCFNNIKDSVDKACSAAGINAKKGATLKKRCIDTNFKDTSKIMKGVVSKCFPSFFKNICNKKTQSNFETCCSSDMGALQSEFLQNIKPFTDKCNAVYDCFVKTLAEKKKNVVKKRRSKKKKNKKSRRG